MDVETQDYDYIVMIHEYMNLDKQIIRKKKKIANIEKGFYAQNFCGRIDFDDPKGIHATGFNVKNKVTQYIDRIEEQQKQLAMLKRRERYFRAFLNGLSVNARNSLERDFKHDSAGMYGITLTNTHKNVIQEIAEIEEAICYEFNTVLFPEHDKDLIAVEIGELSNDTIENSFQTMLNILGVK